MSENLVDVIGELGRAFEEFKSANDARIKGIESGRGVADLEEKTARIDAVLSELDTKKREIEDAARRAEDVEARLTSMPTKSHDVETVESKAFRAWARTGRVPEEISTKAMSAGIDTEGGFLLGEGQTGALVEMIYQTSPLRQLTTAVTVEKGSYEAPEETSDFGYGWVGETDTRAGNTDTANLGKVKITPGEMYAEPRVTQTMINQGAFDIEAWIQRKLASRLSRAENSAFVSGNGVGKPRGFLAYDTVTNASWAYSKVGYVATGQSSTFATTNPQDIVIQLEMALKPEFRMGAAYALNTGVLTTVRTWKDSTGNYIWQPGLSVGAPSTLNSYKYVEFADMPSVVANAYPIAFANWQEAYRIVDGVGVRVLRDDLTLKGWVKFYTTKFVGGGIENFDAIKLVKIAAS